MLIPMSIEQPINLVPQPIEKDPSGLFPFPRTRYGILPCLVTENGDILWG